MRIISHIGGIVTGYCMGMAIFLFARAGDYGGMFLSIAITLFISIFPYLVKWSIGSK